LSWAEILWELGVFPMMVAGVLQQAMEDESILPRCGLRLFEVVPQQAARNAACVMSDKAALAEDFEIFHYFSNPQQTLPDIILTLALLSVLCRHDKI
jgi:hypothetical protein